MSEINNLWACEEQYALSYFDCILNASGEDIQAASVMDFDADDSSILSIEGEEATVSIQGVLTSTRIPPIARFFGFSGTSYPEIKDALEAISEASEVKRVILAMDTPGGDAKGVDEVAQMVAALAKKKTVVAENKGMIASGGYWIASQANKIISSSPSNETGSIGVLIVGYDQTKIEDQIGVKKVVIVSKNAPDKAANVDTKEGIAVLQKRVNALEGVFISRISEGRKVTEEFIAKNFGQGGLLIADAAQQVGMIDGVISKVSFASNTTRLSTEVMEELFSETNGAGEALIDDIKETEETKTEKKGNLMATLKELIAENEGVKAEVEELKSNAFEAGKDEMKVLMDGIKPFINADYPEVIKAMIPGVLSGEVSLAELKGAVAYHDSIKEVAAAAIAEEETEEAGATVAEQDAVLSEDGTINSEDDFSAAVEELKTIHN